MSRGFPTIALACLVFAGCATGEDTDDYVPVSGPLDSAAGADVDVIDSGASPDTAITVDSAVPEDTFASAADTDVVTDTGSVTVDSTPADTTIADTGKADTGALDSGPADTGKADTGPFDTGLVDTGLVDTGPFDTGLVDTGPVDTGTVDPCSVALSYDFEASDQGFTHAPLSTFATDDPWQRGTPSGTTIACHGGTKCFTTGLTANYATCQTAELRSPTLDLSSCASSSKTVRLSFWHYYVFEGTTTLWDGGLLQVSTDGTKWTDVTTSQAYDGTIDGSYSGCSPVPLVGLRKGWGGTIPGGAWKQVTYDIGPAYRVAGLRFRFIFGSDAATNKRGWFIDDVAVTSL